MTGTLRARGGIVAVSALLLLVGLTAAAAASPPGDNGIIVYTDDAGLHTAEADGSGATLVAPDSDADRPDVTADGAWALYVTEFDGELVVVDLATGEDTVLVDSGVTGAAWSGDGSRIAYSTDQVWVADFVAGAPPSLANDEVAYAAADEVFDWSAVDDRLLVQRSVDTGGFPEVYFETFDIGSGAVTVVGDNGPGLFTWYVRDADFSPDGTQIAYIEVSPGALIAMVANADGSDAHMIAEAEGAWHSGPSALVWAPDGTAVGVVTQLDPPPAEASISLRDPATGDPVGEIELAAGGVDWAPMAAPPPPPPPPPPPEGEFDDVPADHTFAADITWLAESGITKGCNPPDNTDFCPNDLVTRGQMAAFLVRALGYTDNGGGNLFDDTTSSTFKEDIDRLATAGVTKGCNPPDNTDFCPNDFVTRGQMAAFLHRALGD